MIKIMYPYVKSRWNEELKYSIRSIEKYFKEPFELWILGELPNWINTHKIKHISSYNKNFKQVNKCRLFDIAHHLPEDEDIIWMNDDIFLLSDIDTNKLKTQWYLEDLKKAKSRKGNNWTKKLFITSDFLESINCTTYNFECHIPTIYNIHKLLLTFERFEELDVWIMNTAYFNYNNLTDNLKDVNDVKIGRYNSKKDDPLPNNIDDFLFLNFDDNGLTEEIKEFIKNKFPEKSRFEI
jgi:hypothetical protein